MSELEYVLIKIRDGDCCEDYVKFKGRERPLRDILKENITLKRRLEKINGGYWLLTHRKGLTANEWVIQSQEKELKEKDNEIHEWIERHSKDIIKIGEQQRTINEKNIEIEELKIHIEKLVDGSEISQLLMKEYEKNEQLINRCKEQKSIITKQDKIIKEAGKTLTDPKNYQSVISIKYAMEYAIKILKEGVVSDE